LPSGNEQTTRLEPIDQRNEHPERNSDPMSSKYKNHLKKSNGRSGKFDAVVDIRYDRTKIRLRCAICEMAKAKCKHTKAYRTTRKTIVTNTIRMHTYQKHRLTPEKRCDDSGNDYVELVDYNKPKISEVIAVLKKIEDALKHDRSIENILEVVNWGMLVR